MKSRSALPWWSLCAFAIAGAISACSAIVDPTGHDGGGDAGALNEAGADATVADGAVDAGAGGDSGAGNGGDAATLDGGGEGGGCASFTKGGPMITAGNVCIDAFEVTNGAYAQFVASADVAAQPAFCSWNTDFMPKCTRLNTAPNAPVTCVDWCDAYAFCAWAGKHLCGAVDGGSLPATSVSKAGVDAWYSACSRDGTRPYPYGNVYMGVCNDLSRGAGAPVDAGSLSACTGGYDGLFDMSGNVVEWLDSCDGNTNNLDHCRFRGGAWDDDNTSGLLKCTPVNDDPRDYADDTQGFRCCSP